MFRMVKLFLSVKFFSTFVIAFLRAVYATRFTALTAAIFWHFLMSPTTSANAFFPVKTFVAMLRLYHRIGEKTLFLWRDGRRNRHWIRACRYVVWAYKFFATNRIRHTTPAKKRMNEMRFRRPESFELFLPRFVGRCSPWASFMYLLPLFTMSRR